LPLKTIARSANTDRRPLCEEATRFYGSYKSHINACIREVEITLRWNQH